MAEGCILIVCASLPTLGPLIRAATGSLTDSGGDGTGGSSSSRRLSGNNNHRMFGQQPHSRNRSSHWDSSGKMSQHQPESDAEGSSLHLRPSYDAIPLVSAAKPAGVRPAGVGGEGGMHIHKTMEVSVSSEALGREERQRGGGRGL